MDWKAEGLIGRQEDGQAVRRMDDIQKDGQTVRRIWTFIQENNRQSGEWTDIEEDGEMVRRMDWKAGRWTDGQEQRWAAILKSVSVKAILTHNF
jgi:hypothetical protein